ncbi:hypothetical protein [Pseudomonas phage PSA28]|nr:hypothetical protein [Pseudomonas phage PSA28]
MKLTYIGMNNGSIKEAHRLQSALRDTRDIIEDCYAVGNFAGAKALLVTEAEELASLEMVMRCDAVHATALPQDGQHSYHWHKAMRPYRMAYVAQYQSTRPAADPDDEANEVEQHQAWLIEQGHDYAVFGGVRM